MSEVAGKTGAQHPILCSECFDLVGIGIMNIIPQQFCAICNRKCLGYQAQETSRVVPRFGEAYIKAPPA